MVKEPDESVDDRVEFSERNLTVSRPLTPSVTMFFRTASDHLCSFLCSPPLLTRQFTRIVVTQHSSWALNVDPLSTSPASHTVFTLYLCIPQIVTPNVFFQQFYNF